ncbi:MAG TPA: glycosyltransferase family 2 protein [Geobacteraceae bacterium]
MDESPWHDSSRNLSVEKSVRVSVIIVNWNGLEHLGPCLESLERQTFRDFEVVVVDNGSADGSVAFLRENHPRVRVVELSENRGFATGNNAGFAVAQGEFIVTLNNDTVAEEGWLAELVAAADSAPDVGMVASRICSFTDPDRIDSLGVRVCRDGMSRGAHRLQSYASLRLAATEEILIPSACAALYRRAMLDVTGFFADAFFAYCEDTDLGLRGRWAGWRAVLASRAVVGHKYSQTGGTFSPLKLYLVERNHYLAAVRNFPLRLLLLVPFFTLCRFACQAWVVLGGHGAGQEFSASASRGSLMLAVVRGVADALRMLPAAWCERRRIMATRRITSAQMCRLLRAYRLSFKELLDIGA